jgi:hypothetical protein
VELVHWLTYLTDAQIKQLYAETDDTLETTEEVQLFDTIGDAAAYAGVDVDTINEWLDNGMWQTEDGAYLKHNLDIFMRTHGHPSEAEKKQQVREVEQTESSPAHEEELSDVMSSLDQAMDKVQADSTSDSSEEQR